MRLSAGLLLCLILIAPTLRAQRTVYGQLKGTVIDSSGSIPLEAATVAVYLVKDSSLITYTLTDRKGDFIVRNIPAGQACSYLITFYGYESLTKQFTIPAVEKLLDAGKIILRKNYKELESVTITGQRPPMVVRNDTLEFDAAAFDMMPNSYLKDLVKQIPGLEIDRQGNLMMNGKKVTKITLDGRDFFSGDPRIALQNLPSDIIDKIQVMDNKSLEARFNKITDGNEDLAINLTLKKDKKKGWFGRASAGYGTDERYASAASINYFDAVRQLNFIGNANNNNGTGNSGGEFDVSNGASSLSTGGNGINKTQSAGLNFNQQTKKLKLNGSYYFSSNDLNSETRLQRQNILPDTTFFYNVNNETKSANNDHRISIGADYEIDSLTQIHIDGNLNFSNGNNKMNNDAVSTGGEGKLINSSRNAYITDSKSSTINTSFFISRALNKKGRGITLGVRLNNNDRDASNINMGENIFYKLDTVNNREDIDQVSNEENESKDFSTSITYNEPIIKDLTLNLGYNYQFSKSNASKFTNEYNPITGRYDIINETFTNVFNNTNESHAAQFRFLIHGKTISATVGTGLQFWDQKNKSILNDSLIKQKNINITPAIYIGYNISKTAKLYLNYVGRTIPPTIQQLLTIPDNSNLLVIQTGNAELRQAFSHQVRFSLRRSNARTYMNGGISFNTTTNQIIYETFYDDFGRQVTRPINVNGNYSLTGNYNYSQTLKKGLSTIRIKVGGSGGFNKTITYTNKVTNISKNYNFEPSVGLTYTFKKLFTVSSDFSIQTNSIQYSVSSLKDVSFNTKSFQLNVLWNKPKRLIIENSLQYFYNSRTAPGFRKAVTMWSAAINWQVFREQQGTIRLSAFDILRQNAGINRIVTQSYIEDRQSRVLQQYFMLSFIYNLKKIGN